MTPSNIRISPVGPSAERIQSAIQASMPHAARGANPRQRLLAFHLLPPADDRTGPSNRFRATVYDYDQEEAVSITGDLDSTDAEINRAQGRQPLPDWEEFQAAVAILRADPELGPAVTSGALTPYRPMPPVVHNRLPDGTRERAVTVGLLPTGDFELLHQIVAVSPNRQEVKKFENGAPNNSFAGEVICGPASAGQPTTPRGTPGIYEVVQEIDGEEIWRMLVVRPAASSGTNGSGVELYGVHYRGQEILKRAHAPILNVRYESDFGCGPAYRDWIHEEGMFWAEGEDVAEGFRRCHTPPQTIFDTGNDEGIFRGVALYETDDDLLLVSELEAGWYRYKSEWRFTRNGVIQPRFGFAGIADSCICQVHHHHVYWRFHFASGAAGGSHVEQVEDTAAGAGAGVELLRYETRRQISRQTNRNWRIRATDAGQGYALIPGANDGASDPTFGVGDVWCLRYHPEEYDDFQEFSTDPDYARAQIDWYNDGESIEGQEVVIWYAGHFRHDEGDHDDTPHIVGPDLVPFALNEG